MAEHKAKKTVRIFGAASFLNDMGSDMIYPIWPLFVTSVLGANMAVLGFIDGLGEALVSISQAVSGYISDRVKKRKIFIWIGYLCGSISRAGYAISSVWQHLIPFRILDRAGKMRGAPRDAIIADVSTGQNRGSNFGFLRAMDNFGAVCGILICIFFFKYLGYRKLFLLAAIPSLIAVILILFFIKEKKELKVKVYKGISFKNLSSDFKWFLVLSSFFALGNFSYSFLLIYAKEFGFRITSIPVLYLLFTGVASGSALFFGKLSDKIGRKPIILLSYLLWAGVCISLLLAKTYPLLVVFCFILYGLHKSSFETVSRTYVSELAPPDYKASSLGGFQMVTGLFALPSSLVAGILWDKVGVFAPLMLSLSLTSISLVMIALFKNQDFVQ